MNVAELRTILEQYEPDTEVRVFVHEFEEALHVQQVSLEWLHRTKYPKRDRIHHDGLRFPRVKYQKQIVVIF